MIDMSLNLKKVVHKDYTSFFYYSRQYPPWKKNEGTFVALNMFRKRSHASKAVLDPPKSD